MAKEKHYRIGKSVIQDGTVKSFRDIFEYVPRTVAAEDMNIHFDTLNNHLQNLGRLTLYEMTALAELLEIDVMTIMSLASTEYNKDRKSQQK